MEEDKTGNGSISTDGLAEEETGYGSISIGGLVEEETGNESTSTISGTSGCGIDSTPDEDDCNINCFDDEDEGEEEKLGMLEEGDSA